MLLAHYTRRAISCSKIDRNVCSILPFRVERLACSWDPPYFEESPTFHTNLCISRPKKHGKADKIISKQTKVSLIMVDFPWDNLQSQMFHLNLLLISVKSKSNLSEFYS